MFPTFVEELFTAIQERPHHGDWLYVGRKYDDVCDGLRIEAR